MKFVLFGFSFAYVWIWRAKDLESVVMVTQSEFGSCEDRLSIPEATSQDMVWRFIWVTLVSTSAAVSNFSG